jgi:cytochrome P450
MADSAVSPAIFNPLQDGYLDNPAPHLAEMRAGDPVHKSVFGEWILFEYEDVFSMLRDPAQSVDDAKAAESDFSRHFEAVIAAAGHEPMRPRESMLGTDPPDHTRLRKLVSKAFTPRTIHELRPFIQDLVSTTLKRMEQQGGGDLIDELAFPLPFDVIAFMLGMPETNKLELRAWSEAQVKTLDPILTDDEIREASDAARLMDAALGEIIEWKRSNPADDLLTALIAAEEDGDRLSPTELADQVSLLFIAGHETTVNLIGTGIYELLRNPAQAELLRTDDTIATNAVDELLRYVAPVQISRRVATADLTVRGNSIDTGSFVLTHLASANRDPQKFGPTSEDLDLTRSDAGQHVSFGSGAHYCLGASLAKLETEISVGSFVRRFPKAAVNDEVTWNGRINLRGLEHLPVSV